ncbi:MAG: universal stress protein [Calditrichia bacterium]
MELPKIDIRHILFTTDFSEGAQNICAYAAAIAKQFSARLTLLHVVQEELLDLLVFDVGTERAGGVKKRLSAAKGNFPQVKKKLLEKMKSEYCSGDIQENDILVDKGNPAKLILRTAEERNCDLIVMGFKGRSALEDAMMGDTVRRVLYRSAAPVLVVKPPERKKEQGE